MPKQKSIKNKSGVAGTRGGAGMKEWSLTTVKMKKSDAHVDDAWLHGQRKTPKGYWLKCEYMPPQVPGPQ